MSFTASLLNSQQLRDTSEQVHAHLSMFPRHLLHDILDFYAFKCFAKRLKCLLQQYSCSCNMSQALVMHSVFSNNTAGTGGGGLVIWSSTPTSVSIINSSFVGNQAPYGAGLSLRENSSVTCTDLVVQNNSASEGGGVAMYESAQVRCVVVAVPGYDILQLLICARIMCFDLLVVSKCVRTIHS